MNKNKMAPPIRFQGFIAPWKQRKLSEVTDRYDNLRVPVTANLRIPGNTPYYGANGIQDYVDGYTHDGEFILVAEDGAKDLSNYPINYVNGRIWVNNHAHVLQGKNHIASNKFLAYAMRKIDIKSVLVGGGRAKLNAEAMMKLGLQLPSYSEQAKIGASLQTIDNLITLHQRKLEQQKKLKAFFLKNMFPEEGETVPRIRFKGFTGDWEQRKIADVAEIITGGTPSTRIVEYWNPPEVPWLSSGEVHKKYITSTYTMISRKGYENSSATMVRENSVLIALAGQGKTRGTVAINRIPLATNQSIAAMTFSDDIDPDYVFSNLENRYEELRRISSGDGSRGGLNKKLVGDVTIPCPTLLEQNAIGTLFRVLNELITLHQRKIDQLQAMKKFMLQNLFV